MRILAVSDVPAKKFYDYYTPGALDGYELILACGDLRRTYLEFLVTMAHCPVIYVRGNHDDGFLTAPPEGCTCAEDQIIVHNGVRILGLGGSYRYRPGECMYTERQMARRIRRLAWQLHRHKGFDILLTHAPIRGLNDFDTLSHRGFMCFGPLLDKYKPRYHVHGHIHRTYGHDIPQIDHYGDTTVVNAFEYCEIEF